MAQYLRAEYGDSSVQFSAYHYNGEYGLPLTIIGAKTGGKNPIKWLGVFGIFLKRIFSSYPQFLVLEYGIDTPNEMDFLLSVAVPDIAILTKILPNHIEQFGTFERYQDEKLKILRAENIIAHNSLRNLISEKNLSKKNIIYYGTEAQDSHILAENIAYFSGGIRADIYIGNDTISVEIPVFGEYQAQNILPIF